MVQARRCGWRKPGKAYFVIETGAWGVPVAHFIVDPPVVIDVSIISTQGVVMLPRVVGMDAQSGAREFMVDPQGRPVYDVYDWVGGDYPNVADFVEEVMEQGLSRLTPKTADYSKVTRYSEYRLVHPQAWIVDPRPYYAARVNTQRPACPHSIRAHMLPAEPDLGRTCAGLWWEDLVAWDQLNEGRLVERLQASGRRFLGARPPNGVHAHQAAVFMRFPIGAMGRWEVVRSDDQEHLQAVENLRRLQDDLNRRTRWVDL